MYGGKLFRTCFRGFGSFCSSSDFVTQYFVDIFSEPPKSLLPNNFRNCSIFHKKVSKLIDQVYLKKIKMYDIKAKLCKSGFTEMVSFFFLNVFCIYRVISLNNLSAGFINTKMTKLNLIFFENYLFYCIEIP